MKTMYGILVMALSAVATFLVCYFTITPKSRRERDKEFITRKTRRGWEVITSFGSRLVHTERAPGQAA